MNHISDLPDTELGGNGDDRKTIVGSPLRPRLPVRGRAGQSGAGTADHAAGRRHGMRALSDIGDGEGWDLGRPAEGEDEAEDESI